MVSCRLARERQLLHPLTGRGTGHPSWLKPIRSRLGCDTRFWQRQTNLWRRV